VSIEFHTVLFRLFLVLPMHPVPGRLVVILHCSCQTEADDWRG